MRYLAANPVKLEKPYMQTISKQMKAQQSAWSHLPSNRSYSTKMDFKTYAILIIFIWFVMVMQLWHVISSSPETTDNHINNKFNPFLRHDDHDHGRSITKSAESPKHQHQIPTNTNNRNTPIRRLKSGWDEGGLKLYNDRVLELSNIGTTNVSFTKGLQSRHFIASKHVAGNDEFWHEATHELWERETFIIFNKYITKETTVVDVGAWIGSTLLFHGQFSKASFGIEADPAAYAVVEHNVKLNRKLNPTWGKQVSVDSGCIVRPEDVGKLTMKAGRNPGESWSGIGKHVRYDRGKNAVKWEVQCYTLPDIFDNYWGIQRPYNDVFVKIDVETYECKLVPSFFDWLSDEKHLPVMYIRFHPQISECTDEEYDGVLKFFELYDHVVFGDQEDDPFVAGKEYSVTYEITTYEKSTSILSYPEYVKAKLRRYHSIVLYQNHHAAKVNKE